MAVEIKPGIEIGITTRNNIPRRLQPSRRAASSNSMGTVWKKAAIIQMAAARRKAREQARWDRNNMACIIADRRGPS